MTPLEEIEFVKEVPLEITVELDRRMVKVRDILDLQEGSILEMSRAAGENIDVYIGRKLVAFGEIVIIENTIGVRITDFRIEK